MVDTIQDANIKIENRHSTTPSSKHKPVKRKGLTALWIILAVLLCVIIIPPAITYVLLFDNTQEEVKATNIDNVETYISDLLVDSFDTASEGHLSITFNQDDLNGFIQLATSQIEQNEIVNNIYCLIDNEEYSFYLELQIPLLPTRVKLTTELVESSPTSSELFLFKIKDLKIGNIGGLYGIARSLIATYNLDDAIENALASQNLSFVFDWTNGTISYSKENLIKDLQSLVNGIEGDENGIYKLIINQLLVPKNFTTTAEEKGVGFAISLEDIKTDEAELDPSASINLNTEDYAYSVETLLNNGQISGDQIQSAFDFLYFGYSAIEGTSFANIVEAIDWQTYSDLIGANITDPSLYEGLPYGDISATSNFIAEQINNVDPKNFVNNDSSFELAYVEQEILNEELRAIDAIGHTVPFSYQRSDGTYNLSYITVNDFYCMFNGKKINLVVGLDINGFHTAIVLENSILENTDSNFVFSLNLDDVILGTLESNKEAEDAVFNMLNTLTGNYNLFVIDKENNQIDFDIEAILADSLYRFVEFTPYIDLSIEVNENSTLDEDVLWIYCISSYRVDVEVSAGDDGQSIVIDNLEIPDDLQGFLDDYVADHDEYATTDELIQSVVNEYVENYINEGGDINELIDMINNNENWTWENLDSLLGDIGII